MQRKTTDIDLVDELVRRNEEGEYDELIQNARNRRYHDVAHPPDVKEPKMDLLRDLKQFPELKDVVQDVLNCEYDESQNEDDIKDVGVTLIDNDHVTGTEEGE